MSLTKISYSMIAGAPANILDFGAIGDGVSDDTAAIQAALDSGATVVEVPVAANFYNVTAPIKIPRGVAIRGHMMAGTIGDQVQSTKPRIQKTTSTTVGIPRYNDGVVVQRDCVFYSEYQFENGFYPQNFEISGLFIGKSTANAGSIGIYHEEGSNWLVEDCYIFNVEHGFYARNIWISRFSNLRLASKFTVEVGGTSLVLTNCSSVGSSTNYDGFNFTGLLYSTLIGCTADAGKLPAYTFQFCSAVSMINCGCEANEYVSATTAWALNFNGANTITVVGFTSVPLGGSTTPIISASQYDNIVFQNCSFDNNKPAVPGMDDVYANFAAVLTFDNCLFTFSGGSPQYANIAYTIASPDVQILIRYGLLTKVIRQGYTRDYSLQTGMISGDVNNINDARYYGKSGSAYGGVTFRSDSDTAAARTWYHLYGTSSNATFADVAIYGNGDIENANNSYGAFSDAKLKENIVDATPKLDDLMKVRLVNFNLKSDPDHKQLGVIAQELEQVFPGLVYETQDKDAQGNDLGTTTKSVKYSVFVPMLIKAVQELKQEIVKLKS